MVQEITDFLGMYHLLVSDIYKGQAFDLLKMAKATKEDFEAFGFVDLHYRNVEKKKIEETSSS